MMRISKKNRKRVFIATYILTLGALIFLLFWDNYPSRIYRRIFPPPEVAWDYRRNASYSNYTVTYPIYQEQKNIVMLGTSLTAYASWAELLNRPDVANRGISGDVTEGILARIQCVIDLKPKICFIEGGINDIGHLVVQDSTVKYLRTMISVLQSQNIKPVLSTVTLVAQQYENPVVINSKIKKLNTEIFNLSKEYKTRLIDLNKYVSSEDFLNSGYAGNDGAHFTGKTYLVWKAEVEKVLEEEGLSIK